MKKKLNTLIKYICKYTNLSKDNAISFLFKLFIDSHFSKLPEKKQIIIIDNLLLFFNTLVIRNEIGYKINKNFNANNILHHITNKVHTLINNIKYVRFY